jgi:hypothetical protein
MTSDSFDLEPLPEVSRPVARVASEIYLRHTDPWLQAILIHGSALKGDIIPNCSDIDLQVYLSSEAFVDGELTLETWLAIHRDLSDIDPAPFRYVQCYPRGGNIGRDWLGPIPGGYHILYGELPEDEATLEEVINAAETAVAALPPTPPALAGNLGQGDGGISRRLRLLTTQVWPALRQSLIVGGHDAYKVWSSPRPELFAMMRSGPMREAAEAFERCLQAHFVEKKDAITALAGIEQGVRLWGLLRSNGE